MSTDQSDRKDSGVSGVGKGADEALDAQDSQGSTSRVLTPRRGRIAHCVELMSRGDWHGYSTRVQLAQEWGIAESTVRGIAAEASRLLTLDEEGMAQQRIAHAAFCARVQHEAISLHNMVTGLPDFGSALKATEMVAKFQGIVLESKSKVELTGGGGGPVAFTLADVDAALGVGEANAKLVNEALAPKDAEDAPDGQPEAEDVGRSGSGDSEREGV